ncbi:MAG: hypothetical protein M3R55_17010 [Acidobacteriota bacterium]|nr:hypothetical protein [Acidobacteriota bacterium]
MATIQSAAILLRIRQVLESGAGTLRTIASTRFYGDLPEGLSDSTEQMRGLERPRVEARIKSVSRSPASPPITGNIALYDIGIDVEIVRPLTTAEQLTDATRDALRALALDDVDVVRQALEYPGNLTATTAGAATDLVSGLLSYVSSRVEPIGSPINAGAQTLRTVHSFTGIAISRPAIS